MPSPAAIFVECDARAVSTMVTDDFEFFHGKWGQIAKSRDEFVKAMSRAPSEGSR
jgi:hypothetical protein